MKKLVAATHNKGKLAEIKKLLPDREILSVGEFDGGVEPEEDGETFRDNALIKARAAFAASGLPSFGDDSGLCVDALDGAPGVHSARYADGPAACNRKLLEVMRDVPDAARTAHFVSVIAYTDGEREFTVEGRCDGLIMRSESGSGGFGYDPLFLSTDLGKSFGEASMDEKNSVSHRGRALRLFKEKLIELGL